MHGSQASRHEQSLPKKSRIGLGLHASVAHFEVVQVGPHFEPQCPFAQSALPQSAFAQSALPQSLHGAALGLPLVQFEHCGLLQPGPLQFSLHGA